MEYSGTDPDLTILVSFRIHWSFESGKSTERGEVVTDGV